MTIEEAKQQIAEKYGYKNFKDVLKNYWSSERYVNEAMELYANNINNAVKELKVNKHLNSMMKADIKLYEKIMDTAGFAYDFNELVKLAMK